MLAIHYLIEWLIWKMWKNATGKSNGGLATVAASGLDC